MPKNIVLSINRFIAVFIAIFVLSFTMTTMTTNTFVSVIIIGRECDYFIFLIFY